MSGSRHPAAVLFDLDGTLTRPLLDFDAIRAEIGLAPGLPILEQLAAGDDALRARGEAVMRRHELAAIEAAVLQDGCVDLLAHLDERRVPRGILTRNTRAAVARFCERFALRFDAIWTREDGAPKPSPEGVLALLGVMGVTPAEAVVVGDFRFDILAGQAAGCRTVLLRDADTPADLSTWGPPDLVIDSLRELLAAWV